MSLRDALRKAAGLLVELPPDPEGAGGAGNGFGAPEPPVAPAAPDGGGSSVDRLLASLEQEAATRVPTKSVEQILQETRGPSLPEIQVSAASVGTPTEAGMLDFPKIYAGAGLPVVPFGAEQMLDLLTSLPAELPLATRRQTVKVSLNALGKTVGASPENLVADAGRKLAALNAYAESLGQQTAEQNAAAEQEIASLQQRIEALQADMARRCEQLTSSTRACEAEADRLDDILEFFSLDVSPSRLATTAVPTA